MHYKIIQIETFPISPQDYITEDNYIGDHWFVYKVADYVQNDENRKGSLEQFKEGLACGVPHIDFFETAEEEGFILHDGFLNAYFSPAFEDFMAAAQELASHSTLSSFAEGGCGKRLPVWQTPLMTGATSTSRAMKPDLSR